MRARTLLLAVTVVLTTVAGRPAAAADFDSEYAIESAFLTLAPGETGIFSVSFVNRGTVPWIKGSSTQVDLAACRADQVTCDSREPALATFDQGSWLRPGRYATHAQSTVPPGGTGTFVYSVAVPANQTAGRFRFNGDLVLAATGARIHPEGYFQELTVQGTSCVPTTVSADPAFREIQVGLTHTGRFTVTCAGGAKAVNAPVAVAVRAGIEVAGNPDLNLSGTTDATGVATVTWTRSNPGRELVNVSSQGVVATATVRWVVPARVLTCTPTDTISRPATQPRSFLVTAKDPTTGGPLAARAIDVTIAEEIPSGTATIDGVSAVGVLPGATLRTVTTDASGTVSFLVNGRAAVIRPRVFLDDNASDDMGTTEFRADCGGTVYEQ